MLQNFGTALSREQMKLVVGGDITEDGISGDGGASCTAKAQCTGGRPAECTGTSTCSATDDDGATCDGTKVKCTRL